MRRVIAEGPGLKAAQLHQGRDLRPTTDLRAVIEGVLQGRLGPSAATLASSVFPESTAVAPLRDLVG